MKFGQPMLTVRMPREQQQALRVLAARRGLSREALVRGICDCELAADQNDRDRIDSPNCTRVVNDSSQALVEAAHSDTISVSP